MRDLNSLTSSPSVAVNAILLHKDKVLFGLRRSDPPSWTVPGGHMHLGETIEECARREILEETGLEVDRISIRAAINDINNIDHTHYINFFVTAHFSSGQLKNGEPEDIITWEWYACDALPTPLFYNIEHFLSEISLAELLSNNRVFVCDVSQKLMQ